MPPPREKDKRLHAIAEQLINARLACGWSRQTLAEESGVPVKTVTNYEQARCAPKLFILLQLLQKLKVDIGWFATLPLDEKKAPPKPKGKSGRPRKTEEQET